MKKTGIIIFLFFLIFLRNRAFAQVTPTSGVTVAVTPPTQACDYVATQDKEKCLDCILKKQGSWTVFGCLSQEPFGLVTFILRFSLGIGGGIAFLTMVLGGFYLLTSAGNPQRINQGKKMIFYPALGVLVIIFSVFILELIGVHILGIPELSK